MYAAVSEKLGKPTQVIEKLNRKDNPTQKKTLLYHSL